jgi:cobalamin synthase
MLPPFVHDALKWLRSETVLPFGSAHAASDDEGQAVADPGAGAYAAPFAAAVAGSIAAGALLVFWSSSLPPFAVAAATVLTLAAGRGIRFESGTVRAGDRLSGQTGVGAASLVLLLLLEVAALEGLIIYHAPSTALVVIVAAIFGSTASIVFRLTQPARPIEDVGEVSRVSQSTALQGLTLVTIVLGTALLLPVFRIGPTAAAFVGALIAFVAVVALAKHQNTEDVPDCAAAAGKAAEAATLFAVLVIIRAP